MQAFDQKVCGCLDRANPVRNIAIAIVSSKFVFTPTTDSDSF
jgi:hypothetical protein